MTQSEIPVNSTSVNQPLGPFPRFKGPLELSGLLDKYESFEITPVLGREFPKAKVVDWMNAPNSDELLRDLAITVSQRGVVVFRAQDDVDNETLKKLSIRLGELTGRPSTSGLHIHPLFNSDRDHGGADNQINCVNSEDRKKVYAAEQHQSNGVKKKNQSHDNWHSDIGFEAVPGDYSVFILAEVPETGGDTMFASGCDIYDRISAPMQKFLETLTAINASPKLEQIVRDEKFSIYTDERGCPENVGTCFRVEHPVVRTNPVTGWKSIYALGQNTESIKGLSTEESNMILEWIISILYKNHDTQARIRWNQRNDLAIWDNRSVFHCATWDYDHLGGRMGKRALCVGERPYFDPNSTSRQESLGI